MVECAVGDNYCNFSIIFGVFSIVCLIAVITEIIIFNSNKHIIVLFIAQTLCITMSLEYFLDYDSKLLYFIKEYLLLISYTVTSYYFIFQAYYLLIQSKSLQGLIYFSLFVSILAFIIITIIFLFNLIVGFYGIPCDNYLWIIMRSLGMMMSSLFMFVGILISNKIKKIRKELNQAELKSRLLFLWLFIGTVTVSNVLKFFQSLAYRLTNEPDCFIILRQNSILNVIIYSVLVLITDYSVILSALYLFYRKGKGMPKDMVINNTFESDLELDDEEQVHRRRSSSSLMDYILYST